LIAVDTNILVYAHRNDAEWHQRAFSALNAMVESGAGWFVPWPCAHEFIAIVTHPRIYTPATPIARALEQLGLWAGSPGFHFIGESPAHLETLLSLAMAAQPRGGQIHDARIAAICLQHGVQELWTADRDFSRYPALKTRNPLAG
jgi:uncharacterized protein